jgi:ribosome recycling factor
MANFDFKSFDTKAGGAKEWLQREYRSLRTGRATPAILDSVQVSAYGSMMPLKQCANVGIEDARTLRVSAYDMGLIKDIERAIAAADLGVGTSSDGTSVRVTFPELTVDRRAQLVKLAKGKLEEARSTVRAAREEAWRDIQDREKEGTLTEDDKFSLKEELQKRVDKLNEELEGTFESKEKEMSS